MATASNPVFVPLLRASTLLGVPLAELKRLAEGGEIPALKLRRGWRVDPIALRQWLEQRASSRMRDREAATHGN